MAVSTIKLSALLAGAAALIAALPAVKKATSLNQTTNSTSATASASSGSATAAVPVAAKSIQTRFGINVAALYTWTGERGFMNLMAAGHWQDANNGWQEFPEGAVDRNGNLIKTGGVNAASAMVMPPLARTQDVKVKCVYEGKGAVGIFEGRNVQQSTQVISFTWAKATYPAFIVGYSDPADPIRNIDCREADADSKALFDPAFVDSLRPYNTVRFMDWQRTNDNMGGDWSKRTLATSMFQNGTDGVAVENMVALANAAHVNPYFTIPFNADATYIENFARYVHDNLDKSLVAYVEVGNEVWNWSFSAAQQSLSQGLALKMDADGNRARMYYYASRIIAVMTVWERVYASDPQRLVRIAAGQAVWPDLLQLAMEYKDTPSHIDAIAMAPYFGYDTFNNINFDINDLNLVFQKVSAAVDDSIGYMKADKAFADRWKKRLICYEAGQHLALGNTDVMRKIQTDARMGDLYRKYMQAWDANGGDLMTIYNSISPLSAYAWGLSEYSGQPISQTPKRKAVMDMITAVGSR